MGKTTRSGGGTTSAGGSAQPQRGALVRGARVVLRDGALQFAGTDGGVPDTELRRSSAGVLAVPGVAATTVTATGAATLSSTLDVTGTTTLFGYLGVGGNAGVAGALDVAGSCSGIWGPRDNGLVGTTGDPGNASGLVLLTGGTIYLAKIPIARDATPTKLYFYITTGATTATASQCWVSVLSSAGALLATAVDIATTSESSGLKTVTVAPGALTTGSFVWGAILCNAAVLPTLAGPPATALTTLTNVGLSAAGYRYATNGTSQTTITTRTPASNSAGAAIWMGLGT